MRIWSLHPSHLDTKGLVALWRETLLAKHVLEGRTKGYKNHPQLNRFKGSTDPIGAINQYLLEVYNEADRRGYKFDLTKIGAIKDAIKINVTDGQLEYEQKHLMRKLVSRDKQKFEENKALGQLRAHPMFDVVNGQVERWEIIYA